MSGRIRTTLFVLLVVAIANQQQIRTIATSSNFIEPRPSPIPIIDRSMPQIGQRIGRYEVTSIFGKRVSPGGIGSSYHQGVDLAMAVGTPILMPLDGEVECHDQSEGNAAGTYARIIPDAGDQEFMAGHLSRCYSGRYKQGQAIALSGSTGKSTGPHLHWAQKPKGEAYQPPGTGYLRLAIAGIPSKAAAK